MDRIPRPGGFYRHFKDKLYQVLAVAEHTETGERLVVYRRDLTEYARLESTDYAGQILVEEDGSVLLISGSAAWRFLP